MRRVSQSTTTRASQKPGCRAQHLADIDAGIADLRIAELWAMLEFRLDLQNVTAKKRRSRNSL
ncbi:MAG: hypothetical protein U1F34_01215 [Gammaproteobacteria bacterium]